MYILMIARGFPSRENPQWGCFEKDQAEALAEYGHKVVVMSVDARFRKHRGSIGLHQFTFNGVYYYNYVMLPGIFYTKLLGTDFFRRKIFWHYSDKLYKRIVSENGKPDIIYSHFFDNTYIGVLLKNKYQLPLVGIEHLARFNEEHLTRDTEVGATFAFAGVDSLIAVSKSLANNLEKRCGRRCEVVHNMYGKEFVNNLIENNRSDSIIFVSTASLVYRKGFDVLIKAFAMTKLPVSSWRLKIIGWGEEKQNLEQLVNENNLQENISFLGRMGKLEIANELRNSNVYVLPSRNENFSVSILEGLAMGLPVLATDCGGIHECIDENNGIIVPVDDVLAMSDAIKEIVRSYSKFDRIQIAKTCESRFSPKAIAAKLTEVLDRVVILKTNEFQNFYAS